MNQIDSVKLKFFAGSFEKNSGIFDENLSRDLETGEEISNGYKLKPIVAQKKILGIHTKELQIDTAGNLILPMSSKILLSDYPEMITAETLPLLLKAINKSQIVQIDEDSLRDAVLLKADVTNNIVVTGEIKNYIESLSRINKTSNKFEERYRYIHRSIRFIGTQKTHPLKFVCYDKYHELTTQPFNKALLPHIDLSRFKDVLRFESNWTNKFLMRKQTGIDKGDIPLSRFLETEKNINADVFESFIRKFMRFSETDRADTEFEKIKMIEKFRYYKKQGLRNPEKSVGFDELAKACNYDMNEIIPFCKELYPNKKRYEIEKIFMPILSSNFEEFGIYKNFIDEIRHGLRLAS